MVMYTKEINGKTVSLIQQEWMYRPVQMFIEVEGFGFQYGRELGSREVVYNGQSCNYQLAELNAWLESLSLTGEDAEIVAHRLIRELMDEVVLPLPF